MDHLLVVKKIGELKEELAVIKQKEMELKYQAGEWEKKFGQFMRDDIGTGEKQTHLLDILSLVLESKA